MGRTFRFGNFVLFFLISLVAAPPVSATDQEAWFARFQEELRALAELSQNPAHAEKGLSRVQAFLEELQGQAAGSDPLCTVYARVVLLRAIFAAQLGRWEEGLWDYHVAIGLDPAVSNFSFSAYPDLAPRFLDAREKHKEMVALVNSRKADLIVVQPPLAEPPPSLKVAKKRYVEPDYPAAYRRAGLGAEFSMFVLIDENGVPQMPLFSGDCSLAAFFVAAADALRQWRYEPPVVNDQPATIVTRTRFGFHLKAGPPFVAPGNAPMR